MAVVIPAFNHAAFVAQAVASAAAQGSAVTEIIVVDDGSTDETAAVVRALGEPRARLLTQTNRGPSAARNAGWRASDAEWIQFLDADDALAPEAISALLAAAAQSPGTIPFGIEAVYPPEMSGAPAFTAQVAARSGVLLDELGIWYQGTILTALFPRGVLEEINGFDEQVRYGEDYDLALRLASKAQFRHVPQITYRARMHPQNRHKSFGPEAQAQYLATIRRTLGADISAAGRSRYRRALAHWLWQFGQQALNNGDHTAARAHFAGALAQQPLKLGAWRGWWRAHLRCR